MADAGSKLPRSRARGEPPLGRRPSKSGALAFAAGYGQAVLDAVTFDFWNTIVVEQLATLRACRLAAWAGILEEAGLGVDPALLAVAYDAGSDRYSDAWRANTPFTAVEFVEHAVERLGVTVAPAVVELLVDAARTADDGAALETTDGIADCLAALSAAGVRLGIICDVGFMPSTRLRRFLDGAGLLGYFDHWSFSDEVGVFKPSEVIFRHALDGLGVSDPARAAHIGDIRRTDIAGAKAMGMLAIRYRGVADDVDVAEPEGDIVVDDHRALPRILAGAGYIRAS